MATVGRPYKCVPGEAPGAALNRFQRRLKARVGLTYRTIARLSHTSYTALSQNADGRLPARSATVEAWVDAIYRAAAAKRIDIGWSQETATEVALALWEHGRRVAGLEVPAMPAVDPADESESTEDPEQPPGSAELGRTLVMDVYDPRVTAGSASMLQPVEDPDEGDENTPDRLYQVRSVAEFVDVLRLVVDRAHRLGRIRDPGTRTLTNEQVVGLLLGRHQPAPNCVRAAMLACGGDQTDVAIWLVMLSQLSRATRRQRGIDDGAEGLSA
jgi:hypothetical protein